MLTLIEMVRKTRANGFRYCAVDKHGSVWSYKLKPKTFNNYFWQHKCSKLTIGKLNLNGKDWKKSLIDVTKIKVK